VEELGRGMILGVICTYSYAWR